VVAADQQEGWKLRTFFINSEFAMGSKREGKIVKIVVSDPRQYLTRAAILQREQVTAGGCPASQQRPDFPTRFSDPRFSDPKLC
jgi:hypothetical protein